MLVGVWQVEGVRHELADLQLDGCEALQTIRWV